MDMCYRLSMDRLINYKVNLIVSSYWLNNLYYVYNQLQSHQLIIITDLFIKNASSVLFFILTDYIAIYFIMMIINYNYTKL